jgi:hypothetical protein
MRHGRNPDPIRQFQEEKGVGEQPQNTLAITVGAMQGKRLGSLSDPLDRLFHLGDEVIPKPTC